MKFVRHHKRQIRTDWMTKQPVEGSKPYTLTSQWHLLHSIRATPQGEEIAVSFDGEFWPTSDVKIADNTKEKLTTRTVCQICYRTFKLITESLDLQYEPD